jgi:hypothetical protein
MGNDPLSRSDHLPRDFCISEIIMILKTSGPKVKEKDETTGDDDTSNDPSFLLFPFLHIIFLRSSSPPLSL